MVGGAAAKASDVTVLQPHAPVFRTGCLAQRSDARERPQGFHVDSQMVQTLLGLALFFMAGYMLFSGRETESVVLTADEQWRLQVLHFLPRAACLQPL